MNTLPALPDDYEYLHLALPIQRDLCGDSAAADQVALLAADAARRAVMNHD